MEFDKKEIKSYLEHLYWDEELSLREISKRLDIPLRTLAEIFEKNRIKTRRRNIANKLRWKKIKIRLKKLSEGKQ